jgi:hypothetical protein
MQIRGKEPLDLEIDDLEQLVDNQVEEDDNLEYKRPEAIGHSDLAQDVSAFLNTNGGVIIVGVAEENDRIDRLELCDGTLDRERLSQLISSNIEPYHPGISIAEITGEQGYAAIIKVPKSSNPPHMATHKSNTYYIRIDSTSQPAPHGQVEALFDKRQKPAIFPAIGVRFREPSNRIIDREALWIFEINLENVGNIGTENGTCFGEIQVPEGYHYSRNFGDITVYEDQEPLEFEINSSVEIPPGVTIQAGSIGIYPKNIANFSIDATMYTGTVTYGVSEHSFQFTNGALNAMNSYEQAFPFYDDGKIDERRFLELVRNQEKP